MTVATECTQTVENERKLQSQNKRLLETLRQYGVDPKPRPGATLREQNQRLRQILQRTWSNFWGVNRSRHVSVKSDEGHSQE